MSRTMLIAGGGIAGLTAALALAQKGFRAVVFEQSQKLEPIGAGIQLSPNAMHVLLGLGLGDALRPHVVSPEDIRIRKASTGSDIVRVPLGSYAQQRYGAPYWMIHRGDLQAALLDAARAHPDIRLTFGGKVQDYAVHANGVTAQVRFNATAGEERCVGLIGADGLWSTIRERLGYTDPPHFRKRTAWRTVVPADAVDSEAREASINLWLGRQAHLVHYPIRAGTAINIVAILRDDAPKPGWNNTGPRDEILATFRNWAIPARNIVASAQSWRTWTLYDRPRLRRWGNGPITMIGDAAHPMLPFLAQGAAMAIEDAAVLADCLAKTPDDSAGAMRRYEALRNDRTTRAQKAASRNGLRYQASGVEAAVRNAALRMMGGAGLLKRYDWLYGWRVTPRTPR
ncbi:MAG TPA: FAD-dependent monooxygenase [Xanthobacteraceae bacterium]|nr:FAD-dependent monooxygenase [Xanthobacteraceae bacterium]